MFAMTRTATMSGIRGVEVQVEVDSRRGLPGFNIVGLGDTAVKEASDRVKSAIINSGFDYPMGKIVVNLSPGWIRKRGSHFDMPIALGILVAEGILSQESVSNKVFIGELALKGDAVPVKGILPMIAGLDEGIEEIYLPRENAKEGYLASRDIGTKIVAIDSLKQMVEYILEPEKVKYFDGESFIVSENSFSSELDYSDVKGHYAAKEAIVVAMSGGHSLLMMGSPGTGKTMLAKRIPTIFPEMSPKEQIETSMVYSLIGELTSERPIISERPFRLVNNRVTEASLIGGGAEPVPGEISLANNGILFMDEFLEYDRKVIEALRKPIEEHRVSILRRGQCYTFPADFTLVAAANPCPCGYYGDKKKACTCSQFEIERYRKRMSGPIAERIDMSIEIERIEYDELSSSSKSSMNISSEEMRSRVIRARKIQSDRFRNEKFSLNSQIPDSRIFTYLSLGPEESAFLEKAYSKFNFSPRRYHKVLKLSRTIADLSESERIRTEHIASAISYTRFFAETGK